MAYEELKLERQLCFKIYALHRQLMAAYRPLLDELGVTYPQYITLLYLWEHEEATVGQLCSALGLDTGTVSPLLKRMEANGLVSKRRLVSDERTVQVSLTERGRILEEEARSIPSYMATCLFGGDEADAETLATVLDRTIRQVSETRKR
ncbi:MAG: MarR family transcriptional regulator [Spirochaetales bacterium]|nr:MarR family transcriptional regulator [Spirochaetales bacterium]